jgi:hypothetical protein
MIKSKQKAVVFDFQSCIANDVFQLRCAAFERGNTAALRAVVRSFVAGVFAHVIKTCHEAFEAGEDLDDDMIRMMSHVFDARLGLIGSIPGCPDNDVFHLMIEDLRYADDNLREFTSAVLVIDENEYDDMLATFTSDNRIDFEWWDVVSQEWFMARHGLDQRVPRGWIEMLLRSDNQ